MICPIKNQIVINNLGKNIRRWINLNKPDQIKLTNGGLICDIKYLDDGCHLMCKNNFNQIMQISMETNLIFQKLNNQEKVILSVIDYLNK